MSRFVVVSFAFLGWGFYELSGGADFKPPERPDPVIKTEQAAPAAAVVQTASLTKPQAEPVLTKRVRQQFPAPDDRSERQADLAREASDSRRDVLSQELAGGSGLFQLADDSSVFEVASLGDDNIQLVSLTQPGAATPQPEPRPAASVEPAGPDIREITGSRVNMRGGPGTVYPVLERLTLGNEVEILGDSGTGWLRLRTAESGKVGWIAASLISKKAN